MSDGALRIPITGDASQFKATLAEIESSLKYFKEKLKSAKGDQVAKINFTIAGLEESKIALTTFGKFAEGTLGALNQQISELNRQKLNIKADAESLTPINQELDKLIKKRDELNKAGLGQPIVEAIKPAAESIAGLRLRIQELNDLKILIDPKLNPSALAKINQEIDGLEAKVDNLENLGTGAGKAGNAAAKGLKNFEDQSRQSRIAVTNLALVLQDLPFGFIAIQNNLPNLQTSLSNLKTTSDGTKDAFGAFTSALAGPGGFFLAFSAVTGAITFAIQKYGSLGAAVDAFLGIQSSLTAELKKASETLTEYNEGLVTNDELIRKQTASTQSNVTKIKALGSIVTDTSKSLDERKAALKDLQKIDDDYFGALNIEKLNYSELKNAIDTYNKSLGQSAISKGFQDRLSATNKELEDQDILLEKLRKRIAEVKAAPIKITSAGTIDTTEINKATSAYNAQKVVVDALRKDQANYEEQLQRSINTETGLKAPILSAAEAYRKKQEELKKTASGTKKLAKAVKDLDIAELERQGRIAAFKLEEQAYKNRLKAVEDNIKAEEKLFDQIEKRFESDAADADKLTKKVAPNASIERTTEPLAELQRQFQLAYTAINQTFFEPLQNLFETFLNTGKFTFKEFTKSVLKSITSIVSKIAATGVITALMYLLDPSGMLASFGGSFGGDGGGNGILSALGSVFGAQPRKPDFNGVRPQGGGRGGEKVEFQIRGTNLVGVLNRANGEINRIG